MPGGLPEPGDTLVQGLAGVALTALIAAWAVQVHLGLGRGRFIDREHHDRIWKGMTQAEVEAILGAPPGNYSRQPTTYRGYGYLPDKPAQARRADWFGEDGYIEVMLDPEAGTVLVTQFMEPAPPQSLAEWVQGWLRRLWP
jgi:hypothetical protein